ncbi:MAG: hypothetical protein ACNA7U_06145 [Candidatus Izemoplasmataceae bacterium]|jgi:hypothetical protein
MNKKRLLIGIITGALLGVVCIIGAQVRSGFTQNIDYLFAFWYNRLLMGTVLGLLTGIPLNKAIIRGIILGTLISFAFYASTGFADVIGFIAGIVYGIIIETTLYHFDTKKISV